MILSDKEIRKYVKDRKLVIEPLSAKQLGPNGIDLRVGDQYVRLLAGSSYRSHTYTKVSKVSIRANDRVLLSTLERVEMPNNLVGLVNLRSSYARLGLTIAPTVIDAGFKGKLTFIVVGSSFPVELSVGDRFWHIVFVKSTPAERAYSGKYQGAKGIQEYVSDNGNLSNR